MAKVPYWKKKNNNNQKIIIIINELFHTTYKPCQEALSAFIYLFFFWVHAIE